MLNRFAERYNSTSILKALPIKLDIKTHSPSILYLSETLKDIFSSIKAHFKHKIGCVELYTDMKTCSLGSIDPLNREAWVLGFRHSSHLLPTPVPETPAAVEK